MKFLRTERRSPGDRRWGLNSEFPIRDSNGAMVIQERRRLTDRRLDNVPLEERMTMFSGCVPVNLDSDSS